MGDLLEGLGLTRDFVRDAFGVESSKSELDKKNYLDVEDQKRIRRRLMDYEKFIIARYLEGMEPSIISMLVGVSEESVRSRLRKADLFNSKGPGRPKKSQNKPSFL